jgi:PKD repeat protein
MKKVIKLVALLLLACCAMRGSEAASSPAPGDENWVAGFNLEGTCVSPSALAVDSVGNLYAAGSFCTVGGNPAYGVAKWDGSSWTLLNSGIEGNYLSVEALVADGAGNLYVGGNFTSIGGVNANSIAMWNGSSWSSMANGVSYNGTAADVNALAIDNAGNLYAGGYFTIAGGVAVNGLAKWNGTAWSAIGSGVDWTSSLSALTCDNAGNVYACGYNVSIDQWNGSSWAWLPYFMGEYANAVICDSHGNLYCGGDGINEWNGSEWLALGSGLSDGAGNNGTVSALAFDSEGNLYVGGNFLLAGGEEANNIAMWNGSAWHALGAGVGEGAGVVKTLACDGADNLYVGGNFNEAGGVTALNTAKWNGASWTAFGSFSGLGMNDAVRTLVFDNAGNLYAGGDFEIAGGVPANDMALWNGTSWSAVHSWFGYGEIDSLAFDDAGNLYACYYFDYSDDIAMWNGQTWSALPGLDSSVEALATDGTGNLYAGGSFTKTSDESVTLNGVAAWNGSAWSALGSGLNGSVWALVGDSGGNLYAGGSFSTAGGVPASNIAKWNGSTWSALGAGTNFDVYALALDGSGNLFAGGANYVGVWNGSSWSTLGSVMEIPFPGLTMTGLVYSLAVDGLGNLYAGGYFTTAGGMAVNAIAKWDGTSWSALGSGTSGNVYALACDKEGNLFAGGNFTMAGGQPAACIAEYLKGGTLDHFYVEAATGGDIGTQVTGVPFAIAVEARDANNNIATSYNGTVNITSTGTLAAGSGTTANFANGVLPSLSLTISNLGDFTVTASGGGPTGISNAFQVLQQVTAPTFSPAAGNYDAPQSVTISSFAGAAIYYTTDGSTPTTSSALYSGPIVISQNTTITALAAVSGMVNSAVTSAAYLIAPATPTFSLPAGTYAQAQTVSISCATSGAFICYTTDGSIPTLEGGLQFYPEPISISQITTLKAMAIVFINDEFAYSSIASATYFIQTATPTFSLSSGVYTGVQSVALSCETSGAQIYFSVDGVAAVPSYTLYTGPLNISQTTTITAIAVAAGLQESAAASETYTFSPPTITSPLAASAPQGVAFAYQITASGDVPMAYAVANLPAGLNFAGDTISGLPTACGEIAVTLTATNSAGSDTETLLLTIQGASEPAAPTIDSPPVAPAPVAVGEPVTLSVSASDAGVDLLLYTWNFGDSTSGTGSTVTHVYASPGVYFVTVKIANGTNSTTETIPVIINATGVITNPAKFAVAKAALQFVFNKVNSDSMTLFGTLPVPDGFTPNQNGLTVIIGEYTSDFTLNAKGEGSRSNATESIKLSGKKTRNGSYEASSVKFIYTVKKQNLFASLQAYGFSNANVANQTISMPILMDLDLQGYQATVNMTYQAKKDKSGLAK